MGNNRLANLPVAPLVRLVPGRDQRAVDLAGASGKAGGGDMRMVGGHHMGVPVKTTYKIDKGVPIPRLEKVQFKPNKYPFPDMEVGDSFFVPLEVVGAARVASGSYSRNHSTKFTSRKEGQGLRIWRTA